MDRGTGLQNRDGEMLHLCFRCTWTLERLNKSDIFFFISSSRLAFMKMSQNFSSEMLFSYPKGTFLESSSCYPKQAGLGPTVSEWRCFKQTEWWGAKEVNILRGYQLDHDPWGTDMGKGFRLKGRTGVKECLAFQTPNPLPVVWNASVHTHAHTRINMYTAHPLCRVSVPLSNTCSDG